MEENRYNSTNISLLYPDEASREKQESITDMPLSDFSFSQLELADEIDAAGFPVNGFFTSDTDIIKYRQETFSDMLDMPELSEMIRSLVPLINDIVELRKIGDDPMYSSESYLYSITEVELYTSSVSLIYDSLHPIRDRIKGRAFRTMYEKISELIESDYYKNINSQLNELTSRVREVKSVTIGVNLDQKLKAESAGVISINNDKFKSGHLIDKILRLDFRQDNMTCIAPLTPFRNSQSENQQVALSYALSSALGSVFKSSMRSWKNAIRTYVLDNTNFLIRMLPEFEFVLKATDFLNRIKEKGLSLTFPEIAPEHENEFTAEELYNPVVALKISEEIVYNDFAFDDKATVYILTGPNRGGKSVITCAVGQAFAMTGLGLPVCASKCRISPADRICTHFPQGNEETIDKGRLGEECSRLEEIIKAVTPDSLVLLDETFSSTGAYEASVIASEVICGLSYIGCRTIFSTHLHELAARTEELNRKCLADGGSPIDNLVAEHDDSKRNFKIKRKAPDGRSYASDISDKYGLSYDLIKNKTDKRKGENNNE